MSAGELDGDAPPRPFRGFSINADDTPRDLDDEALYDDALDEAEPEYGTFEPAQDELTFVPPEVWDEATARSPGFGRTAGVALLVVLAVGAGFALTRGGWTSKELAPPPATTPALRTDLAPPPPSAGTNDVAVAPEAPGPALAPSKPVQEDRARPVSPAPPAVHLAQVARPPPRFVDPEVSSNASVILPAPVAVAPAAEPQPPPAPIRPSFDCQGALTRAQQMVCSDPRLAAADRRMSQAYAAALAAGPAYDELRSEQADWVAIREDAARYSNRAVLNIYEQRTRELEALTEDRPE